MIKGCSLIVHRRVYIKINMLWIRHSNTHSYRHTCKCIYDIQNVQQVHTYALLLKWLCSRTPVCPLLYHVSWMHTQLCWQSSPTAGQDRNTVTLIITLSTYMMLICIPRSVFGQVSTVIASLAATFCWLHDGQQLHTYYWLFIHCIMPNTIPNSMHVCI